MGDLVLEFVRLAFLLYCGSVHLHNISNHEILDKMNIKTKKIAVFFYLLEGFLCLLEHCFEGLFLKIE